jgi:hypothetical protein
MNHFGAPVLLSLALFVSACGNKMLNAKNNISAAQLSQQSKIIAFYSSVGKDQSGRKIEDIWKFSYEDLESIHDFIQWLFPLDVTSVHNSNAPVLTEADQKVFHQDQKLRSNLLKSFDVMMNFYGFERTNKAGLVFISKSANFGVRSSNWLRPYNHNHLRISRILKSLRLLGMGAESKAFFLILSNEIYPTYSSVISEKTFEIWKAAALGK